MFGPPPVPPKTDGSGNIRDNLRQALRLLREAGWAVKDGRLTETATGQPMAFEILGNDASDERIAGPFVQNLERLGIQARIRIVDAAQYQNRTDDFDFDMITDIWGQSASPGNEQRDFWGSAAADRDGSRNTAGIKNPAVDKLIDKVVFAKDREELLAATHALDRVLLWNFYVVPQWHYPYERIAYWDVFGRPAKLPSQTSALSQTWWFDADKQKAIDAKRGR